MSAFDNIPDPDTPVETKVEVVPTKPETQEPSQGHLTVTLKGGKGYDAPWVVLTCATVEQAVNTLENPQLQELLDKTSAVGQYFAAKEPQTSNPLQQKRNQGGYSPSQGYTRKPLQRNQPPGSQEPPSWVDMSQCPQGWVFKTGISKKGKRWYCFDSGQPGADRIWLQAPQGYNHPGD